MIRQKMVRILFDRELKRLRKNPSALMLIGLLAAIALLAATSDPTSESSADGAFANPKVLVVFDKYDDRVKSLINARPESSADTVRFGPRSKVMRGDVPVIPHDWSVVELNDGAAGPNAADFLAHFAGDDASVLDPFLNWFVPAAATAFNSEGWINQTVQKRTRFLARPIQDSSLSDLIQTEVIGTTLLLMVQFFACCHLLVSFTAEDRERRTLNALALSPASLGEIMFAKALFHMCLSIGGCALITAIISPVALASPLLWLTVVITSVAMMSVGTCIATLAKNQASAGMLALCYMMAGAILFFLSTKLFAFQVLKGFTFESYTFPLLYFIFKYPGGGYIPAQLVPLLVLAIGWVMAARKCFYRFGWRT